jgi:CheY-like chemotaxis protein
VKALKNLTVHVVEDEIIIALDLEDILEDMGHNVDISYTVKDALKRAAERKADLFLIDIQLHGEDTGLEIGKALQQHNIPHIYLSAYTDEETRNLAESTNSLGYLNKPFNEREFKEVLEGAADKIVGHRKP